ncbi:MAG: RidA family protein [bacterium]|nr:reactive intermediate/imine deaminase [Gemmatimonas sp.]MDO9171882.1 RidA family protein [bacterium]
MSRKVLASSQAPAAVGPYSQGVAAAGLVFTAGQIGLDPATGKFVPGGVVEQARRALDNARAVVEAGGATLADVVKVTVFLADMGDFAAFNEVYREFFTADFPARSAVGVAALPVGALVEVEMIAATR